MHWTSVPRSTTSTCPCHRPRGDAACFAKDVSPARFYEQAASLNVSIGHALRAGKHKVDVGSVDVLEIIGR